MHRLSRPQTSDGMSRKTTRITSTHSPTNQNKNNAHTHNYSRGYFPSRHHHNPPAPEHQPEASTGTFAPWRMVVNRSDRLYRVPHNLPANEMKAFYESAIEPECPLPDYDPAMDEPEPPTPRRKPPFKVTRYENGYTYRFDAFLVSTGYHAYGKYAAMSPWDQPVVLCNRKCIANLLRHNRKAKPC